MFLIEIRHVMRLLLMTSIVAGFCVATANCGRGAGGPKSVDAATSVVAAHLPKGWMVATREDGQLPQGHYWGDWGAGAAFTRDR